MRSVAAYPLATLRVSRWQALRLSTPDHCLRRVGHVHAECCVRARSAGSRYLHGTARDPTGFHWLHSASILGRSRSCIHHGVCDSVRVPSRRAYLLSPPGLFMLSRFAAARSARCSDRFVLRFMSHHTIACRSDNADGLATIWRHYTPTGAAASVSSTTFSPTTPSTRSSSELAQASPTSPP